VCGLPRGERPECRCRSKAAAAARLAPRAVASCTRGGGQLAAPGKPFAFSDDPRKAWKILSDAGKNPIRGLVKRQYASGESWPGTSIALQSSLLPHLRTLKKEGDITPDAFSRLVLWLDIYGQYEGHFNAWQEEELLALRKEWSEIGLFEGAP
jgi:hypothetical protein